MSPSEQRRGLARRVAAGHASLSDPRTVVLVSGSVVEDLADEMSDVDMGIVFTTLPEQAALQAACDAAGGEAWHWQSGDLAEGGLVVAFRLQDVEVQIAYSDHARLERDLAELLVAHNPDTPLHKLAEGLLKAAPLAGAAALRDIQRRLSVFPPELSRAMAVHFIGQVTPWRAISQLLARDASLWCRELQVQAGYRLLGALAGLNDQYFTTFQVKRLQRFVAKLKLAPVALSARLERALMADAPTAFAELHGLEGEVLSLLTQRWPDLDLDAVRRRRAAFGAAG